VQTGYTQKLLVNRTESSASRSRCGVRICSLPKAPRQWQRSWSARMMRMFGSAFRVPIV